jgi:positive regulator of sigma E activity
MKKFEEFMKLVKTSLILLIIGTAYLCVQLHIGFNEVLSALMIFAYGFAIFMQVKAYLMRRAVRPAQWKENILDS